MSDKIFKSTWTWRTLEQQEQTLKDAVIDFHKVPRFIDGERESMLRKTRRSTSDRIHVASISNIAKDDDDLRIVVALLNERKAFLHCEEENTIWHPNTPLATWMKSYKQSRTASSAMIGGKISAMIGGKISAMIGGKISAANRKAKVLAGAKKIADRWKLPSGQWPTAILLKEAGVSLNSIKAILGKRPLIQAQHEAALKRKEKRNAKT